MYHDYDSKALIYIILRITFRVILPYIVKLKSVYYGKKNIQYFVFCAPRKNV